LTDKAYFLQAENEFESQNLDAGVLAKANYSSRGIETDLKHKYIELRVQDLIESAAQAKKDQVIAQAKKYGKLGWSIGWKVGAVGACLFFLFVIVYVLPNL